MITAVVGIYLIVEGVSAELILLLGWRRSSDPGPLPRPCFFKRRHVAALSLTPVRLGLSCIYGLLGIITGEEAGGARRESEWMNSAS